MQVDAMDITKDQSNCPVNVESSTPSITASPPPSSPATPLLSNRTQSPNLNKTPPISSPSALSSTRYSPITNSQSSPITGGQYHSTADKIPSTEIGGSVRHLEAAMTRHLPQENGLASSISAGTFGAVGNSFSTIQWAGGQEPASTTILRQFYAAKRETVIRTSRDSGDLTTSTQISTPSTPTSNVSPSAAGILSHNTPYPGYNITPPSSISPERLKNHPCDPYADIYSPLYTNPGPPKNPYDALRSPWYPA